MSPAMRHPLDGARLKVIRAQEHLDAFDSESRAFLNQRPYRFDSEIYPGYWWIKPHLTQEPPKRLSLLVGDCLTNIKSSLDYVIWELANRYFSPAVDLRQADRKILTFPILLADPDRRQGHIDHLRRLAKRGMPTSAIDVIASVQDDVREDGPEPLRWLYELANIDKHRYAVLTVGTFVAAQVEITGFRGANLLIRSDIAHRGLAVKTETMPPDLVAFIREQPMNVNVNPSADITTPDLERVEAPLSFVLDQVVKCATDVIPRFETFF